MQTVRSKLFDDRNIQTLSSVQLTEAEMTHILELHLGYFNRTMSEEMVKQIVTVSFKSAYECMENNFSSSKWETLKTMTGFPETVRLFVSNDELFDQEDLFFEQPYVFFRNCLDELFLQKEKCFALFLIWSMPEQKLKRSQIDMAMDNRLANEHILEAARWIRLKKSGEELVDLLLSSLSHIVGGIITYNQRSGEYIFSHNVAKDMVGIVVGKQFPNAILKLAKKEFLLQYTTVDTTRNDDIHVFIEPFRYDELKDAIVKAMQIEHSPSENINFWTYRRMYFGSYRINISMLKHDCFTNESFLRVFCNSEEGRDLLFKPVSWISGLYGIDGLDFGDEKIPVHLASEAILVGNAKLLASFMKFQWETFNDKKRFLYMSLLMAARVGLEDAVELLLRYGAETNEESIFMATSNKHTHVVELLLEKYTSGSEAYNRILNKNSPLIMAAKKGYVDVLNVLIKYGFDVNYSNTNKKTALHRALLSMKPRFSELSDQDHNTSMENQFEAYKMLIENGATFTERTGKFKRTQLHTAADMGHTEVVKLLIEEGASLKDKDYRGHFPVHCAAIRGHYDAVREILNADRTQVSVKLTSPGAKSFFKGMTLLHIAIWKNDHQMVKLLLEYNADPNIQDSFGRTSFYFAAYRNCESICESLIKCSNVQQPDTNGLTPLHAAVFKGHKRIAQLIGEVIDGKEHAVESHLKLLKGRKVFAMAALERAIFHDKVEDCEYLLQNGADLNYNTGHFKRLPLHFAADAGSSRTAELLISRGASLNAKDCRGYIPIQCAAIRGNNNMVKMILQVDETQAHAKLTSFGKFQKRTVDLYHIAVVSLNGGLIDVLLQYGVDPNFQDIYGKTPISAATSKDATDIVKKLIPFADVNLADNNDHIPLHTAVHIDNADIVSMLCPVSDIYLEDRYGESPLSKASRKQSGEIVNIFLKKFAQADLDFDTKT